jgi:hypothetical protein
MLGQIRARMRDRLSGSGDVRLVTLTYPGVVTDLTRMQADFDALRRGVGKLEGIKSTSMFIQ